MAGTTHAKDIAVSKTFPPSRNLKAKVVLQPVWRLVRGAYMGSDAQMDSGRVKRLSEERAAGAQCALGEVLGTAGTKV